LRGAGGVGGGGEVLWKQTGWLVVSNPSALKEKLEKNNTSHSMAGLNPSESSASLVLLKDMILVLE
jgi:hypothetical protein